MTTCIQTNGWPLTVDVTVPASETNRKRKRKLTEARREQNRLNQRLYRQKQREQRCQGQGKQSRHSSAQHPRLQPRPLVNGLESGGDTRDRPIATDDAAGLHFSPVASDEGFAFLQDDHYDSYFNDFTGMASGSTSMNRSSSSTTESNLIENTVGNGSSSTKTYHDSGSMDETIGQASSRSSQAIEVSEVPGIVLSSDTLYGEAIQAIDFPLNQSQALTKRGFTMADIVAAGVQALLHADQNAFQAVVPGIRLPNPRTNNITFYPNKIVMACIQNAQSMGFFAEQVLTPACLAQSPYYRQLTPSDDPKQLLAALTKPSTPASLKPTLPQLLYPHPAFFDLIPMPNFRARAITLAATQPQLFDMKELKRDMVVEDGLVLWSSHCANVSPSQKNGQGQPWDIRSWEAAPWFLRKWRLLVDGEEGEIWKYSCWWQSSRGE